MLKINGYEWGIYAVSPHHPILIRPNGSVSVGVCDKETLKIYINEELEGWYLKKVICHEIVHAAMFSYGVILAHNEEEVIADLIASYGEEIIDITNSIFSKYQKNRGDFLL